MPDQDQPRLDPPLYPKPGKIESSDDVLKYWFDLTADANRALNEMDRARDEFSIHKRGADFFHEHLSSAVEATNRAAAYRERFLEYREELAKATTNNNLSPELQRQIEGVSRDTVDLDGTMELKFPEFRNELSRELENFKKEHPDFKIPELKTEPGGLNHSEAPSLGNSDQKDAALRLEQLNQLRQRDFVEQRNGFSMGMG
jgi:hypothetical protein